MSPRQHRRALIRRVLEGKAISSQDALARELSALGVQCTQATLSRDLRDMGVSRENGPDGPRYRVDPVNGYSPSLERIVGMEIVRAAHNGQVVVVRTLPGRAQGVAAFLDGWQHPDILGTLAGDDTVFVAPTNAVRCGTLLHAIEGLSVSMENE